jgi:glycyl-tRNA synthetase beta chain
LSRLTYHEKLGAYNQKVERMAVIAHDVLAQLGRLDAEPQIARLIHTSKVDLLTLMVGEFPELQGVMAGLYAQQEGYSEEDCQALYDHYLPITAEDRVPRGLAGALLSLCDRIEVLVSGYILNMIPTGSKDPYALRRVATGAARILLEHALNVDLRPVFDRALTLYDRKTKLTRSEMLKGLVELMEARFRFLMEQKGIAYDTLNAILGVDTHSLLDAAARVNALWAKRQSDDIKTLARCFKRIHNIISNQADNPFDAEMLVEDGEKRLHKVFSDLEFRVRQLIDERQYLDALEIMVTLGPEIDNFFDEVLVMAEDMKIRNNRMALLQTISRLYRRIADFSQLQIEQ